MTNSLFTWSKLQNVLQNVQLQKFLQNFCKLFAYFVATTFCKIFANVLQIDLEFGHKVPISFVNVKKESLLTYIYNTIGGGSYIFVCVLLRIPKQKSSNSLEMGPIFVLCVFWQRNTEYILHSERRSTMQKCLFLVFRQLFHFTTTQTHYQIDHLFSKFFLTKWPIYLAVSHFVLTINDINRM